MADGDGDDSGVGGAGGSAQEHARTAAPDTGSAAVHEQPQEPRYAQVPRGPPLSSSLALEELAVAQLLLAVAAGVYPHPLLFAASVLAIEPLDMADFLHVRLKVVSRAF